MRPVKPYKATIYLKNNMPKKPKKNKKKKKVIIDLETAEAPTIAYGRNTSKFTFPMVLHNDPLPNMPTGQTMTVTGRITNVKIDADIFEKLYEDKLDYLKHREIWNKKMSSYAYDDGANALKYMYAGSNQLEAPINEPMKEPVSKYRHYFQPEKLPVADIRYDPDFLGAFTWGPLGEWIGEGIIEEFRDKLVRRIGQRRDVSSRISDRPTINEIETEFGFTAIPLDHGYRYEKSPVIFSYADYKSMRSKQSDRTWGRTDDTESLDRFAASLTFAGMIQRGYICLDRLDEWVSALKSTQYAAGFGALRSGDNRFDPFGVLAQINEVNWLWSDREGAYTIEGLRDPCRFDPELFAIYLKIDTKKVNLDILTWLIHILTCDFDSVGTFKCVTEIVEAGELIVGKRMKTLEKILNGLPDRHYYEKTSLSVSPSIIVDSSGYVIHARNLKVDPLKWRPFKAKYDC